ncbi:hypothetical protein KIN20_001376 [Parelaphostrongylus tenuis]|uniref:7TM GPCR serpentine receptor class x (Srx) domain-containing protein n=1 Tax=Parelaphostrongylus tenuis TaxID=148309 RepID=A0AAD5LU08_PARTN|nr:hypothetical protein KIN20_001376 [Parelaphostrongylus tenuis]
MWAFSKTPCGHILSVVDFYGVLIVSILILLFDCITIICLRAKHASVKSHNPGTTHTNVARQRRQKMESRFFKQALCENALFIFQHVSFYRIGSLTENHWAKFVAGTLLWELCHALDGIIVAVFHSRIS